MADPIRFALESVLEVLDQYVPPRDCHCHINPPCGDCVEWGLLREVRDAGRAALVEADKENPLPPKPVAEPAPPPPCPRCRALTTLVCGSQACPNRVPDATLPGFPVNQSDEE